jgi:sugar phosphate isomerase/epimerase
VLRRRDFVVGLGLAALGGWARPAAAARLETIGLQLYTVRRDLEKDFEGTLAQVAKVGFREVGARRALRAHPQGRSRVTGAPLVHVKDMDATPKKYFTEVGKGVVDFRRVFAQSSLAGIRHYFVEQDETKGSAIDSARVSYEYLKSLDF